MGIFVRASLGALLLAGTASGAWAQQAGPQPAEPTQSQEAATDGAPPTGRIR